MPTWTDNRGNDAVLDVLMSSGRREKPTGMQTSSLSVPPTDSIDPGRRTSIDVHTLRWFFFFLDEALKMAHAAGWDTGKMVAEQTRPGREPKNKRRRPADRMHFTDPW